MGEKFPAPEEQNTVREKGTKAKIIKKETGGLVSPQCQPFTLRS